MKQLSRNASLFLIVFIISLFITTPVLAIPTLPSSFYGTVKVNAANVRDGTVVQALIGGKVCAEGFTQTYQGSSVYALDVPGYNADTASQAGGREGDTIQFEIGGVLADQTALWHSGTNVNLNLTASSSGTLSMPQATLTPVPTQTAIVILQPSTSLTTPTPVPTQTAIVDNLPSTVPTTIEQPSPNSMTIIQPPQAATRSSQSLSIRSMPAQPSLTSIAAGNPEKDKADTSGNSTQVLILLVMLVFAIISGSVFLTLRRKRN
jgi:hypothetical protein